MSVLIKDLEIPVRCADCICYTSGLCYKDSGHVRGQCPLDGRPDWCPMEEVKDGDDQ